MILWVEVHCISLPSSNQEALVWPTTLGLTRWPPVAQQCARAAAHCVSSAQDCKRLSYPIPGGQGELVLEIVQSPKGNASSDAFSWLCLWSIINLHDIKCDHGGSDSRILPLSFFGWKQCALTAMTQIYTVPAFAWGDDRTTYQLWGRDLPLVAKECVGL